MAIRGTTLAAVLLTAAVTVLVVLAISNLTLGNKQIDDPFEVDYGVADPQFVHVAGALLGRPIVSGNQARSLQNGAEIFPAMLSAIANAKQSVCLETYIYWSGNIGKRFSDALSERARAGVEVKVMLDWFGSGRIDEARLDEMRQAGVEVRRYNPPRLHNLGRLNNRTHRKLLIVDGTVGFTGGAGIADEWSGDARNPAHWRDSHYRLEGPAVAQMQAAFMDNWIALTGEVLTSQRYFPALAVAGRQAAQVFISSAGGGAESAQLMYLLSIAAARESIRLSMSYFVPDDVAVRSLVLARQRGVRIRIILPGPHMDRQVVRRASRSEWGPLLAAGVEIYEYQPTMYHCKVMVIDDLWTSVGSTNFDSRSFSVNDEANLNIYDAAFAAAQTEVFERDLLESRQVTLHEWQNRPWSGKLLDQAFGAFSSQL